MSFAVRRRKSPIGAKMSTAILKGVTCCLKVLDPFVERNHASNLLSHFPAAFATELLGTLGVHGGRQLAQDFPFGAGFSHLPRKFRREHHASLGARFGPAIVLF